ncbi:hypothetical protein HY449_00910 [Candidatus Pacearchaeota archaeon]|nr:hypothetical protein [Candidatus Pacearchaeota archaeon]
MYPKHFLERFWEGEQKNQIFLGAPFNDSIKKNFSIIDDTAKKIGFERAFRVGIETEANSIPEIIFDSIANSRMLLFDLSDDNRFPKDNGNKFSRINQNVIYELGVATTIREPSDIVIIRKRIDKELNLPFDIQNLHINLFDNEISEEFIKRVINDAIKKQELYKNKRVLSAIESLDEIGLSLMKKIGRIPKGHNHFNSENMDINKKASLFRLIDLGIVKFAYSNWSGYNFEYAYHWTSFGYEVMKAMGINQMNDEEFEKSEEYKIVKKAEDNFYKIKDKFSEN